MDLKKYTIALLRVLKNYSLVIIRLSIGVVIIVGFVLPPPITTPAISSAVSVERPNIVVIMVDDLDVNSLNVVRSLGWMQNLENYIINQGITFTNSFVTYSLCCPSRATFLTGQYAHNHGVLSNIGTYGGAGVFNDKSTIAVWLHNSGYRTGHVGKYLNGYGTATARTYIPSGWDDWQGLVDPSTYGVYGYTINDNGVLKTYGTQASDYQTDVLASRAVDFIAESESNDSQPFFQVITPLAPHMELPKYGTCTLNAGQTGLIRPAPRHLGDASSVPLLKLPSFNETDVSDKPPNVKSVPLVRSQHIPCLENWYRGRLEAMRAVDDLIGTVTASLINNGELDKTVMIFTSDNGYLFGEHRLHGKSSVYEESIRVPLFIRLPSTGPKVSENLVLNNDLAPTILELAGLDTSVDRKIDGRSLVPLFEDPDQTNWRSAFLVETYNPNSNTPFFTAIRTKQYLYVEYNDNAKSKEFYDLSADPYQLNSLSDCPDCAGQKAILRAWLLGLQTCKNAICQSIESLPVTIKTFE